MPRTVTSSVFSKKVGASIQQVRGELGISQTELARRMRVSQPYIAAIESGRQNLTVGQLAALAGALGVGFDVVFNIPARQYRGLTPGRT